MKRENLEWILQSITKEVKRFVTSRDLFLFLIFLVLSASLWVLHALRRTYETAVDIPITFIGLPNGYVITNELDSKIHTTITGQGTNLVLYRLKSWTGYKFQPIVINLSDVENGKRFVLTKSLMSDLQRRITSETTINRIEPDTIHLSIEKLMSKRVPVEINGTYELAQQYTYCDSIEYEPNMVTIYGPLQVISEIQKATMRDTTLQQIKDTLVAAVQLQDIPGVTFSDSLIHLTIRTERYTEKSVQTPISINNLPHDRILRMFPSVAEINFRVGLSNYEKVDASSFSLSVDYQETKTNTKLPIVVKYAPDGVFNVKISPSSVDYIIEEKRVK